MRGMPRPIAQVPSRGQPGPNFLAAADTFHPLPCYISPMNEGVDKVHYLRIPKGHGARAEMVRLVYVLAGKPYIDVFTTFAEAGKTVAGKNPFKQFPFVETSNGRHIYQALAIMHHVAHGTPAW